VTGVVRPGWPGKLTDADRAELDRLVVAARRDTTGRPWPTGCGRAGVPVAALGAVLGVGESRVRRVAAITARTLGANRSPLAGVA